MIVYYFSKAGKEVAERIGKGLGQGCILKGSRDFKISEELRKDFYKEDSLVFVSSVGIGVRMISPYVEAKDKDPAVVVVDDLGRFTISLLSGHLGGANDLALTISDVLSNTPVITTASDSRGIEAGDLFARRMNYTIDDLEMNKLITAMLLDEKKIYSYSETGFHPKGPYIIKEDLEGEPEGWIYISSRPRTFKEPVLWLIPHNINVGIGARRGISLKDLEEVLEAAFKEANLDIRGIKTISSIDIKKEEQAIVELGKKLKVPFITYTKEEILEVDHIKTKSDFVLKTLGVPAVSEPAALLSGGDLVLSKYKDKGITISITKEKI